MIKEITISGFKAIQSVKVRMSDLTVFIGNNGSGKSSLIEALQTLQTALRSGLTDAFNERWLGMEYILNQQVEAVHKEYGSRSNASFPGGFQIELKGQLNQSTFLYSAHFNKHSNGDTYLVVAEHLIRDKKTVFKSEAREASVSADITIGPDEHGRRDYAEPDVDGGGLSVPPAGKLERATGSGGVGGDVSAELL